MQVRPKQALIVKVANLRTARPVRRDEPPAFWEFTWIFILKEQDDGTTRLLVRERVGFGSTISQFLMAPLGPVSFVMTRKMLRGIKTRAENFSGRSRT